MMSLIGVVLPDVPNLAWPGPPPVSSRLWAALALLMPLGTFVPPGSAAPTGAPAAPIPRSVWLYEPDPGALPAVTSLLDEVLDMVNPANRRMMVDTEIRIHVIPQDWDLTQLPPWSTLRGLLLPQASTSGSFVENRTFDELRGLGPPECIDGPLDIAIAEEQLVALPQGEHPSPDVGDLGKILVHEVGHGVECSLTTEQSTQLDQAYKQAAARYPTGIVGDRPDYSASNRREYFAEGTTAWFEAAEGSTYRRSWLKDNDPALYDLMSKVYASPPDPQLCGGERATNVLRPGARPFVGTPGADVIVGTDGNDVISGGGGDDRICGGGGDDTLAGGYGDDRLYGGPGRDVLEDSSGKDLLVGGPEDDTIDSRDGRPGPADRIDGSEGYDDCEHDDDDTIVGCIPPPPPTTTTTAPPTTTTTAPVAKPPVSLLPSVSVPDVPVVTVPTKPTVSLPPTTLATVPPPPATTPTTAPPPKPSG